MKLWPPAQLKIPKRRPSSFMFPYRTLKKAKPLGSSPECHFFKKLHFYSKTHQNAILAKWGVWLFPVVPPRRGWSGSAPRLAAGFPETHCVSPFSRFMFFFMCPFRVSPVKEMPEEHAGPDASPKVFNFDGEASGGAGDFFSK